MKKLYRIENRVWLGDAVGDAIEMADLPAPEDSRWTKGVPVIPARGLPLDILLLERTMSGTKTVSLARTGTINNQDVNHPLLSGCVAWMPLYLLADDWKLVYERVTLDGVWADIGNRRFVKWFNNGLCSIEANFYDGKVILTGRYHSPVADKQPHSVGAFHIPSRAQKEIDEAVCALEKKLDEHLALITD